jgi:hypothetical protein
MAGETDGTRCPRPAAAASVDEPVGFTVPKITASWIHGGKADDGERAKLLVSKGNEFVQQ